MIQRMRIGIDAESYAPITVKPENRFKGTLLIAPTGFGKTVLLGNIVQGDSYSPVGRIIVDPSGFWAHEMYSLLKGKAHYMRLGGDVGANPMLSPYTPFQIADLIKESLDQMVRLATHEANKNLTVKMMQILDANVIRCIELGRTTLDEVRASIAAERGNSETRDGLLARLDLLLSDPQFKQLICNKGFEINKLIENQETLIVDCSAMGYAKQVFIGSLITNLTKAYFLYSKPKEYKPLILIIDEAHNFISEEWTIIAKQARKYKIASILSTTDFSMLSKPLIHSLLSNSGTLIVMKAGFIEAQMIANEFTTVTKEDIQGLEKYHAYAKTDDGEFKVKLPRPVYVREIPIKTMKQEKTFGLKWFDIDPAYSFHLSTIGDAPPVVDQRQGSD